MVEIRTVQQGKQTKYTGAPSWVSNPEDPLFFMINRGTNAELVINLYKLLDMGVVLVEHDALEGPFGGVGECPPRGIAFPVVGVTDGDLFYRSDEGRLYVYVA